MNIKQLFVAFSMITIAVVAKADQDKKAYSQRDIETALNHPGFNHYNQHNPFNGCRTTTSADCNLVIGHLLKSLQHNSERLKIEDLEDQITELKTEQLQKPIQNRLAEARKKHPHGKKSYWATLQVESEQNALIDAAANIAEKDRRHLSSAINELTKALNK